LKHYGFETFEPWIDESYDLEPNHEARLDLIVKEMHRINSLSIAEQQLLVSQCLAIAQKNKQRFFSKEFYYQVTNELHENVATAGEKIKDQFDLTYYQALLDHTSGYKWKTWVRSFIEHVTQGGSLEQYQRHEHSLDDKSSANGDNV
jgi:hypothetical protein